MPRSVENSVSLPIDVAPAPTRPHSGRRSDGAAVPGGVRIAPLAMTDVADVAALEARVFPDPWSADSFLAEVERKPDIGHSLVVRDGAGELVAYAVVWFIVDEIHIGNIAVAPEQQGRGLGRRLLEHVLSEGRARDMVFATLEVRPSNRAALALYERFGFRKVAVRKNYYHNDREDALVLAVALDPSAESRL